MSDRSTSEYSAYKGEQTAYALAVFILMGAVGFVCAAVLHFIFGI